MFRFTFRRLAVSPYALFVLEQKGNPALEGLPFARRGRMLGRLYRGLSPRDRAALQKRAAAHPKFKRHPPKAKRPRGKSAYTRFVKKHIHDPAIVKLPAPQRFSTIANMWRAKSGLPPLPIKKAAVPKKPKANKARKPSSKTAKKKVKAAASAHKGKKLVVKKKAAKKIRALLKATKAQKKHTVKVAKKARKGKGKSSAASAAKKKKSNKSSAKRK